MERIKLLKIMQKYFSELENMCFQFERTHQISSTIHERKNTKPHHCGILGEKREREDPKGSWREKADLIQKIRNPIVQISSPQYDTRS